MNNFYSIDRLVEFGLGMGIAQQMVKVMNETMQNMTIPGSVATIAQPSGVCQQLYAGIDGKAAGPFTEAEFRELVTSGKVNKNTLVWQPGQRGWQAVENVPSVLRIIALTPPPLPPAVENK